MAVDAFFVLSGYLMMKHARRTDALEPLPFLCRKIRSFLPESFLAMVIGCGVVYFCTGCGLKEMGYTFFLSLLKDVFLLKMTGLVPRQCDVNGVSWYLSSLILGMALLYPCCRRWGTPVALPVLSVLLLGYIMHEESAIGKAYEWRDITYVGNFRAVAELGLGAFGCTMASELSLVLHGDRHLRGLIMFPLAVLKYGAFVFALVIAWNGGNMYNQAYFIMAMWVFIVLSFADVGPNLNCPFALFLGKYSLMLYLGHIFWARNLSYVLPDSMPVPQLLLVYFVFSVATALLLMVVSAFLRKFCSRMWSVCARR